VTACDAALGARPRLTDKLADTKTTANPSTWKQLATGYPEPFLFWPATRNDRMPALIRQRRWMRFDTGTWGVAVPVLHVIQQR